jgi:hypothetical protein
LTPEEIENLRRIAVPNPEPAPAPVQAIAAATEPKPELGNKLALAAQAPMPKAVQALETVATVQPKPAVAQAAPAVATTASTGPSRKTLELALAATADGDTEAARAIRDLVESGAPSGSDETVETALAAVPVPRPNPLKPAAQGGKAAATAATPAASRVNPDKVGRYALASSGNLGAVKEIIAPGYAPGTQDAELVVAAFRTSQAAPVTGKFTPAGNLPALTLRTN